MYQNVLTASWQKNTYRQGEYLGFSRKYRPPTILMIFYRGEKWAYSRNVPKQFSSGNSQEVQFKFTPFSEKMSFQRKFIVFFLIFGLKRKSIQSQVVPRKLFQKIQSGIQKISRNSPLYTEFQLFSDKNGPQLLNLKCFFNYSNIR